MQITPLFEYRKKKISYILLSDNIFSQIVEICRHLAKNDNYTVQGYWLCKCKHELFTPYTLESLKKYLENPIKMHNDFFDQRCKVCNGGRFLISFRVYKELPPTNSN